MAPKDDDDSTDGQVSEVQNMDDAGAPISDSQGVAGNPEAPDAGAVGEAGPNANPHRDEETH
jgi:hypothetical protein